MFNREIHNPSLTCAVEHTRTKNTEIVFYIIYQMYFITYKCTQVLLNVSQDMTRDHKLLLTRYFEFSKSESYRFEMTFLSKTLTMLQMVPAVLEEYTDTNTSSTGI